MFAVVGVRDSYRDYGGVGSVCGSGDWRLACHSKTSDGQRYIGNNWEGDIWNNASGSEEDVVANNGPRLVDVSQHVLVCNPLPVCLPARRRPQTDASRGPCLAPGPYRSSGPDATTARTRVRGASRIMPHLPPCSLVIQGSRAVAMPRNSYPRPPPPSSTLCTCAPPLSPPSFPHCPSTATCMKQAPRLATR